MRPLRSVLWLVLASSAGCYPSPGAGDGEAAMEIVYAPSGVPSFAGQALVVQSCGAGQFCHTDGIEDPADHLGAPEGLGFDLRIASVTVEFEEEQAVRLAHDQLHIYGNRNLVWSAVSGRHMPPGGAAGMEYVDSTSGADGTVWERVADDGVTFSPLPGIETDEGLEIFRNWLASGAPVVERTIRPLTRLPNVAGFTVPLCERTCVDVNWPSIYDNILLPSCALSRCHDSEDPEEMLDMETGGAAAVHALLLDVFAEGSTCRSERRVRLVAGSPDESLLYMKVSQPSTEVCGSRMPLSGNPLTEQRLCAIREWIACGACVEADDTCSACEIAARDMCGVTIASGAAQCIDRASCPNHL